MLPAGWGQPGPLGPDAGGRNGVVGTAAGRGCGQAAMTAVSPARMGLVNNRRVDLRQV